MVSFCIALVFLAGAASAGKREGSAGGPTLKEWKEGKQAEKDSAKAEAAVQAKMAAVDKVLTMLEDLREEVSSEGEKEAQTYNKFACFCKDSTRDKSKAIQTGTDTKATLSSDIDTLSSDRDDCDQEIQDLKENIALEEKEKKEREDERAETYRKYSVNAADLDAALSGLEGAMKVLKGSKNPSFVQLKGVANTVHSATVLADALGLMTGSAQKAVASLLQQDPTNEVPFENYKFHSNDIIATLEKLFDDFRTEKEELDKAEVASKAEDESYIQLKTDWLRQLNNDLKAEQKKRSDKVETLEAKSQELTTVAADLLDDQQYLQELAKMCSDTAKTYDQRSQVRQDELAALTSAIGIIGDSVKKQTSAGTLRFAQQNMRVRNAEWVVQNEAAMEAIEAEAEDVDSQSNPASFLQINLARPSAFHLIHATPSASADVRQAVIELFKQKGKQLHSAVLTSLASQIGASDPFAKIKVLIQELIERLLQEAANEANQKGWCDKATADAKQKRDYAAGAIRELNGRLAELDARNDTLAEELDELAGEIAKLKSERKDAEDLREKDKNENKATVDEAKIGLSAVEDAIDILDKFYKTVKKEKVDLSLAQGPADDAPGAGFDIGEAYTGAQGGATGIIGMMEVIQSDFVRTITETEEAEAKAEDDHLEFMTKTGKSLAEKDESEKEKTSQRNDAMEKFQKAEEDLDAETQKLQNSLKELLELKPACVDTGMSYEDRVALREDEIESLKKALCILQNYEKNGPDGVLDGGC